MALTATATRGFEPDGWVRENHQVFIPGDPGVEFSPGNALIMTNGVAVKATTNTAAVAVNRAPKTVTVPSLLSYGFPNLSLPNGPQYGRHAWEREAHMQTLLPVMPWVPVGTPIMKVTFSDHWDDTVLVYNVGTPSLELTTGMTADDYPNGGILYIYEGPGAGEFNVVEDYDHTGHTDGELALLTHRKFTATPTAATKIIVLGGEASANLGVGFFGRTGIKTGAAGVEVDDHANNGVYLNLLDAFDVPQLLKNLTTRVIPATYVGLFA